MLDDVILMLWPTINPDGHQMTAEWHMQRAGTATPSEPMPALYQEFVGHDNNRDGYMLNMIESRVMEHTWRQWEPNIIYVHHQSAPFPTRIWLPPFAEPIALHTPYIVSRELNMIGMAIARKLDAEGKVGATHMGSGYDAWYPGYVDYAPAFKNIPAFWTETQGRGAAPTETRREQIAADMQRPQSLYSSPWLGGRWTLRDQVEYMKTASIATLEYAAKYKDSLLYGRYLAGKAQIAKGRSEAPYAYVVPQAQRDPVAAVEMLRRLAFAGVRVVPADVGRDDRGRTISGRHVDRSGGPGVRGAGARSARRAEVPGDSRVTGRSARPALRRRRLDAAVVDGRAHGLRPGAAVRGRAAAHEARRRACRREDQAIALHQHQGQRCRSRSTARQASASIPSRWREPSCRRPGASSDPGRPSR